MVPGRVLTAIALEQGRGPLEGLHRHGTFGKQGIECGAVLSSETTLLLFHGHGLPAASVNCKKT
jgi:hypothetical protein